MTGKRALTGTWLVRLLFRPNGPTANTFHNRLLIDLDVSPFENWRPYQRRQAGNIEDIAKWDITSMSVGQYVGRGKLWNDWNAVRNKGEINKISLISGLIVSLTVGPQMGKHTKAITSFAT